MTKLKQFVGGVLSVCVRISVNEWLLSTYYRWACVSVVWNTHTLLSMTLWSMTFDVRKRDILIHENEVLSKRTLRLLAPTGLLKDNESFGQWALARWNQCFEMAFRKNEINEKDIHGTALDVFIMKQFNFVWAAHCFPIFDQVLSIQCKLRCVRLSPSIIKSNEYFHIIHEMTSRISTSQSYSTRISSTDSGFNKQNNRTQTFKRTPFTYSIRNKGIADMYNRSVAVLVNLNRHSAFEPFAALTDSPEPIYAFASMRLSCIFPHSGLSLCVFGTFAQKANACVRIPVFVLCTFSSHRTTYSRIVSSCQLYIVWQQTATTAAAAANKINLAYLYLRVRSEWQQCEAAEPIPTIFKPGNCVARLFALLLQSTVKYYSVSASYFVFWWHKS